MTSTASFPRVADLGLLVIQIEQEPEVGTVDRFDQFQALAARVQVVALVIDLRIQGFNNQCEVCVSDI